MEAGAPLIILADDDVHTAKLAALVLEMEGFAVVRVSNGREALTAARSGPRPDLILLDARMPVMGGIDCLRALRADPTLRRVPVLISSGSDEFDQRWADVPDGAAGVVLKPWEPDVLVSAARSAIATRVVRPIRSAD